MSRWFQKACFIIYHSAVLEGEVVGKRVSKITGEAVITGKSAIVGWRSSEFDLGTELVQY
jgi:hypothetical protein